MLQIGWFDSPGPHFVAINGTLQLRTIIEIKHAKFFLFFILVIITSCKFLEKN